MLRRLIVFALISASSSALAGGSRASDLSGYLNNISQGVGGNPQWTLPQWQTPVAVQRPVELNLRRINNHKGNYFYKTFTLNHVDGTDYNLKILPNAVSGYELNEYGDTKFNAVDNGTGRRVVLKVPRSAW